MEALQMTIIAVLVIGTLSQSPVGWNTQQQFPLPALGVNPGFNNQLTGGFNPLNSGVNLPGFADRFGQGFLEGGIHGTNVFLSPPQLPMAFPSSLPSGPQFLPSNSFNSGMLANGFRGPAVPVPSFSRRHQQSVLPPNFIPMRPTGSLGTRGMGVHFPAGTLAGPVSNFPSRRGPLGGVFNSGRIGKPKMALFPRKRLIKLAEPKKLLNLPVLPMKY